MENEKKRAIAGWYRKRNEAAYAESPDKLIEVALEDAKASMQKQGYSTGSYPKNRKVHDMRQVFSSAEAFFTYTGSQMNDWTKESGQEHMCNVYSLHNDDGTVEYFSGPVYTGSKNNVIIPYLENIGTQGITVELAGNNLNCEVQFEGVLHSHPNDRKTDNDQFSWGDALVSVLSGKIYLTTPHGHVYALDKGDGRGLIVPAMLRDFAVRRSNQLQNEGVLKNDYPALLRFYLDTIYPEHQAFLSGSNFETIDAKTYDAAKEGIGGHMRQKQNARFDWKVWLLAIESSMLLFSGMLYFLRGCTSLLETPPPINYPGYNYMYIHAYPQKLTYVIGKDQALDLTGGMVCYGDIPKRSAGLACTATTGENRCIDVQSMETVEVVSEIDFTAEGIYMVVLEQNAWPEPVQCAFPIQVISPKPMGLHADALHACPGSAHFLCANFGANPSQEIKSRR